MPLEFYATVPGFYIDNRKEELSFRDILFVSGEKIKEKNVLLARTFTHPIHIAEEESKDYSVLQADKLSELIADPKLPGGFTSWLEETKRSMYPLL